MEKQVVSLLLESKWLKEGLDFLIVVLRKLLALVFMEFVGVEFEVVFEYDESRERSDVEVRDHLLRQIIQIAHLHRAGCTSKRRK
jgi:uncharacterized protein YggL (DUF469 family)